MTEIIQELVERDSIKLFNSGGCHIFAVTLQTVLPDEKYELVRVSRNTSDGEMGIHHVYARSKRLIVDIGGIKAEGDYLAWLRAAYGESIAVHVTSRIDLYKIDSTHPVRGLINRWGLCVDEEFIRLATDRAVELISESTRYYASLVFAGERI